MEERGDTGSGECPYALVINEIVPAPACFMKGMVIDTKCIVARTLTFMNSSYSGMDALVGPTIPL